VSDVARPSSPHLLIVSHDVVAARMAGPGIRSYHLARVLAQHVGVTLAVPNSPSRELPTPGFTIKTYAQDQWASLAPLVQQADVCLVACDVLNQFPQIGESDAHIVIDGYDPLLAEWLALNVHLNPARREEMWRRRMAELNRQYLWGDFYLCASERQRDWWLGLLEASGRINPMTYAGDPSLRNLVDLVPYGLDSRHPQRDQPVIKGVWEGISASDIVVLWGGGLWPWLDPFTAIRAIGEIWRQRQDIKLVFPGAIHPNPTMAKMQTHVEAAKALTKELNLLNQAVFFGDWIPYTAWDDVLLESDLAVTLHYDTLETRLAFRSRLFEYIRGNLPIVATRGDATSELVARYGLGRCVDYQADAQVAAAILELVETPKHNLDTAFAQARAQLTWEQAAQPLIRYCRQPWRAADRQVWRDLAANSTNQLERALLLDQIQRQADLIAAYERGAFMRTMRALGTLKQYLFRQK
jgi:glycosyltransferase involved in cell wall biosynthesis